MSENLKNLIITILIIMTFVFISLFFVLGIGLKFGSYNPQINKILISYTIIIILLILRCIGFSVSDFATGHPLILTLIELILMVMSIISDIQCNHAYSNSGVILYINLLMFVNIIISIITIGFCSYNKMKRY